MSKYLVISAIGSDRPGIVNELTRFIAEQECEIQDSRMSVLGGEFAILLLVSGNWSTIAKLESLLPGVEQNLGMTIQSKPTGPRNPKHRVLPYAVDVISINQPGIVHTMASFFSLRDINIEELSTSAYYAAHTGTPMFSVHLEIGIPADRSLAELRESFMDLCDDMNLDAVLEPIKS